MSAQQSSSRGSRGGRGRGSGRRRCSIRSDTVTIRRRELVGQITGNGSFSATTVALHAGSFAGSAFANLYGEYRYTELRVELVPRCSSATLGNVFVGWQVEPPLEFSSLVEVSQLSRFNAGPAFGRNTSSTYDAGARSRRWLEALPSPISNSQSVDPDIIQVWLTVGDDGVQSGVVSSDIYISYSLQLRGAHPNIAGGHLAAAAQSFALPGRPPVEPALEESFDEVE
jgi:hypothetical protein